MKEIYPDIFCITEMGVARNLMPPVNLYVIAGYDGLIFDAGYGRKASLASFMKQFSVIKSLFDLQGRSLTVTRILPSHTHSDHFSGAAALREKLGVSIMLTPPMAEKLQSRESYMERYEKDRFPSLERGTNRTRRLRRQIFNSLLNLYFENLFGSQFIPDPDIIIEEETEIIINGRPWLLFPTPGHMTDHVSLYDRERGILLGGDNILKNITTWLGPPDSDLDQYMHTLKRIRELPGLKMILSSHGSPITNPIERIDELISWRRERLDHVQGIIASSGSAGISLPKLVATLYPGFHPTTHYLARGWIRLSVQYLEKRGTIGSRMEKERLYFVIT